MMAKFEPLSETFLRVYGRLLRPVPAMSSGESMIAYAIRIAADLGIHLSRHQASDEENRSLRPKAKAHPKMSSGRASECYRIDPETGEVLETIIQSSQSKAKVIVSPAEIKAGRSPAGAWTRATLAKWGVPWPPPKGWKKRLEDAYRKQQRASAKLAEPNVFPSGQNENLRAIDLPGNQGGGVWAFLVPSAAGFVKGQQKRAHIWVGDDTLCRMASTGGVNAKKYTVSDETRGFQVCHMCMNLSNRHGTDARPEDRVVRLIRDGKVVSGR